jgi:hypothetical protein
MCRAILENKGSYRLCEMSLNCLEPKLYEVVSVRKSSTPNPCPDSFCRIAYTLELTLERL